MIAALSAVLLACSASAAAPAPSAAPAAKPAVAASTAAAAGASTATVSSIYTGDRYRDPFLPPSSGGGPVLKRETSGVRPAVDIHALQLRGIMKDAKNDFALFSSDDGSTLVLRAGRLYDDRGKPVPGITGRIQIRQKRAQLVTADKDVQIYSLGEMPDETDKK